MHCILGGALKTHNLSFWRKFHVVGNQWFYFCCIFPHFLGGCACIGWGMQTWHLEWLGPMPLVVYMVTYCTIPPTLANSLSRALTKSPLPDDSKQTQCSSLIAYDKIHQYRICLWSFLKHAILQTFEPKAWQFDAYTMCTCDITMPCYNFIILFSFKVLFM